MRNRAELTDEELGFACGGKLVWANFFLGIMFGSMAWVPVMLIYAGMELAFPGLPTKGAALAITFGASVGGGVLWGVIAAERYRDISFRFNRVYFKVLRDNIVRTQILWEDVESVRQGAPYVIQTRQGLRIEVPSGALLSERHDNRALKNQLAKFAKPQAIPSPKKFAWIGFVTLCIGVPLFAVSKRPYQIFAETDGLSSSVWLQIIPSVVGATCTVTGFVYVMMWFSLLSDRKKRHPYVITAEGIIEGKKLIRWTEIRHVSSFGSEDMQIQIQPQSGLQRLIDCEKYTNGTELRDAILAMAPASVTQQPCIGRGLLPGQTLTAHSWTTQRGNIGCLGIFAGMALIPAIAAATGRMAVTRPSDSLEFELLGSVLFVMLVSVIFLACYRVDLNENEIRFQRKLFPVRRIALNEIEAVEIRSNRSKNGPIDLLTIRAKHGSITFSSNLEKYDEIRDSILRRVPEGKVRYS